MSRKTPLLVLAVCAAVGSAVWAYRVRHEEASQDRGAAALVRAAYGEGRRVALKGRQRLSMPGPHGDPVEVEASVLTAADGRMRIEYLSEPLQGVTVWEDRETTYRFDPGTKRLTVAHRRGSPDEQNRQELQLLENYRPTLEGYEYVASRRAAVVELRPRSGGDHWTRLSIDPVSSVTLAKEDRHEQSEVLRSMRFLEVDYLAAPPPDSAFRPSPELVRRYATARPGDSSSRFEVNRLSRLLGIRIRVPAWLPRGYMLEGAYQTLCSCPQQQHPAVRLEYTDGLNTLTLFQCHQACPSGGNCFGSGTRNRMAVEEVRDGISYLAVGDLHPEDLHHVIRSAR